MVNYRFIPLVSIFSLPQLGLNANICIIQTILFINLTYILLIIWHFDILYSLLELKRQASESIFVRFGKIFRRNRSLYIFFLSTFSLKPLVRSFFECFIVDCYLILVLDYIFDFIFLFLFFLYTFTNVSPILLSSIDSLLVLIHLQIDLIAFLIFKIVNFLLWLQ